MKSFVGKRQVEANKYENIIVNIVKKMFYINLLFLVHAMEESPDTVSLSAVNTRMDGHEMQMVDSLDALVGQLQQIDTLKKEVESVKEEAYHANNTCNAIDSAITELLAELGITPPKNMTSSVPQLELITTGVKYLQDQVVDKTTSLAHVYEALSASEKEHVRVQKNLKDVEKKQALDIEQSHEQIHTLHVTHTKQLELEREQKQHDIQGACHKMKAEMVQRNLIIIAMIDVLEKEVPAAKEALQGIVQALSETVSAETMEKNRSPSISLSTNEHYQRVEAESQLLELQGTLWESHSNHRQSLQAILNTISESLLNNHTADIDSKVIVQYQGQLHQVEMERDHYHMENTLLKHQVASFQNINEGNISDGNISDENQ